MKNDVTVEYVELNKRKRGRVTRGVLDDEIIVRHKKYMIQKIYPFDLQQYVREYYRNIRLLIIIIVTATSLPL